MKLIRILFILLILFSGCRTKKQTIQTSSGNSKIVNEIKSVTIQEETSVSNDKTSDLEITTIKTTYYQPESNKASEAETTNTDKDIKGAIQSIEVTTTKKADVDKSKTEITQAKHEEKQTGSKEDNSIKVVESKSVKVPIQWGWIFGVLVVVIGAGFYLNKKFGIINRIKKLIA